LRCRGRHRRRQDHSVHAPIIGPQPDQITGAIGCSAPGDNPGPPAQFEITSRSYPVEEPTFAARYPGTCATCRQRFAVGDPIASVVVDKKTTYHHGACRYPATVLLSQTVTEADVDAVCAARNAPKPGKCRATTNKGKPGNNAPEKGEQFCGPHLTQRVVRPTQGSASGSATKS
jgi:hypothetical protein